MTMQLLAGGCRLIGPDEGVSQREGTRTSCKTIGRATGAREISQTLSRFAAGRSPAWINPTSEEVHFVVSGHGACYVDGHRYEIEAGSGIYVPPAAPCCFLNETPKPLVVLSACCPEPDDAITGLEPVTVPVDPVPPPRVVHERDRQSIPTGDRTFKLLADKDLGCQRVTQFLGVIPPSHAPHHYHTYEEAIYILEGQGIMWTDDQSGPVGPGTAIYLPPGVRHCLENPSGSTIRLLGVFYPSGSPAARYEDSVSH